MKPVCKTDADGTWKPIPRPLEYVEDDQGAMQVSFKYDFTGKVKNYWFAYCYPFSY